jgi:hypothetical protein
MGLRTVIGLVLIVLCLGQGAAANAAAAAEGIHWQPLDEPGSGGWITGIAVSPHDGRRVLMGGDVLGIGLSEDRGNRWQPTFGLPSWEIGNLTWHPTDAKVAWAGTMSGPCRSTDGGRTWQLKREGFPPTSDGMYSAPIEKVLFDPADANHLLAFGGSNRRYGSPGNPLWGVIWESRDGGERWTKLATITAEGSSAAPDAKGRNIVGAAFAAGPSMQLYAAVDGAGLFVSTDGGKTWAPRNAGLPHASIERVVAHPKDRDTLWVCLTAHKPKDEETHLPGGIFKSSDAGKTWTSASNGLPARRHKDFNFTSNFKGFAVALSNPDVMYTADGAWDAGVVYRSTDGGRQWRPVATKGNVGQKEDTPERAALAGTCKVDVAYFSGCAMTVIAIDPKDPGAVYAAGSEYLVRSLDGGKSWTDATAVRTPDASGEWRGRGFSGLCAVNFRFDPFRKNHAVLLAMDAGKCWESLDGLKSWSFRGQEPWPWGGGNDATFARDGRVYVTTGQFGGNASILRTTDDKAWTSLAGKAHGLPEFQGQGVAEGVYALPDDSRKVWAVIGGGLYRSTDGGDQWVRVQVGPGLAWLVADPRKPARFYVSGARNVYATEDGETFKPLGGPKFAGKMTVDSLGRLYVVGYRSARPGLWRYAEGQWARLFDEFFASNVAVDPTDPNRLAVATNDDPYHDVCRAAGVWISADAGKTWSVAADGLAMLRGHAVAFNPFDPEQIVYGTLGRGYFVGRWPKAFAPVGSRTYRHTAEDTAFAAVDVYKLTIRNGSMTEGETVPAGWTGKYGDCEVGRDTKVFKGAPASLCVSANGKGGQAFQEFEAKGGETFRLAGWLKSASQVKVNVAVQSFHEKWSRNQFDQVKFVQNDTDWTEFEKDVTIPDWAARFHVLLLVEGTGKAWLDDVRAAGEAVDVGKTVDGLAPKVVIP